MELMKVLNHLLSIILYFYADTHYPRKLVQEIVDKIRIFICNALFSSIKDDIIEILERYEVEHLDHIKTELNICFVNHGKVFDLVENERLRLSLFKNKGLLEHKPIEIGRKMVENSKSPLMK